MKNNEKIKRKNLVIKNEFLMISFSKKVKTIDTAYNKLKENLKKNDIIKENNNSNKIDFLATISKTLITLIIIFVFSQYWIIVLSLSKLPIIISTFIPKINNLFENEIIHTLYLILNDKKNSKNDNKIKQQKYITKILDNGPSNNKLLS